MNKGSKFLSLALLISFIAPLNAGCDLQITKRAKKIAASGAAGLVKVAHFPAQLFPSGTEMKSNQSGGKEPKKLSLAQAYPRISLAFGSTWKLAGLSAGGYYLWKHFSNKRTTKSITPESN